jgi:hypothetical protein
VPVEDGHGGVGSSVLPAEGAPTGQGRVYVAHAILDAEAISPFRQVEGAAASAGNWGLKA